MYRHGDVLLKQIQSLPKNAHPKEGPPILAKGEKTGHAHQIANPADVSLYTTPFMQYLEVTGEFAFLVHEEHATIKLPTGIYQVWKQREYTPTAIRTVYD